MKLAIVNLITRTFLSRKEIPQVTSNKDTVFVKFAKGLQNQGFDLDLYISDCYRPSKNEDLGLNIIYLSTLLKSIFLPTLLPFTPSLFNKLRNKYDVVVCSEVFQWSTVLAVLSKIFSFKRELKIIIWQEMAVHQRLLKRLPSLIFHRIILRYFLDRHIYKYIPRGELAKVFLVCQGINKSKITHPIPHGIDQNVFFYDLNVKKENYIFSPSRLVFSKGIDILIKAFAIVQNELKNLKLVIQGEGPNFEEFKSLSKQLEINEQVEFCTNRITHEEMRLKYQKALVTVMSSRSDLMLFSVMESIACGTPVIISNGIDIHVNFLDEKGGLVFSNGDYIHLAKLIIKMVNSNSFRKKNEKWSLEKSKLFYNSYICKLFADVLNNI